MLKKLPYGLSNFADLIESGYAYVDKTRFVEMLENEHSRYNFFIRPRRFGKSLFISILDNYYDLNQKDKFESLFNNLYIGQNPTPERGTYAVMRFNFSGLDTETHEFFRASFLSKVSRAVQGFLERYSNVIKNVDNLIELAYEKESDIGILDIAFRAAASANIPVYVIIDEYDHFANDLIAMGPAYKDEVKKGGLVRAFYELLKIGTESVVRRIFITGITPMMINDLTSGFNMASDYSLDAKYNEMFGFTKEEVEWLMRETGVDRNLIEVDMEAYYNGYMFSNYGENKVFNSQMILYLFNQMLRSGDKQPQQVIDTNLRVNYERLRRLAENDNNREILLNIVKDGGIFGEVAEKLTLENLNSEEYFVSLLFYLGMLTNGGMTEGRGYLKIPNYSIKTLYWDYAISYVQESEKESVGTVARELANTIREMAYRGNIIPYLDFFTENFLKRLSNRDLINFDEKYIKAMMLATLFKSRFYLPVSEDENINGYTDIYLFKHPAIPDIKLEYVFEVKYIKICASKEEREAKFAEAMAQIEKYKKDTRFINRDDLKFAAIVFEGKGDYEAREA